MMNGMLSYLSCDENRMFTYFHSLLPWAVKQEHTIPLKEIPKVEEVVRLRLFRIRKIVKDLVLLVTGLCIFFR